MESVKYFRKFFKYFKESKYAFIRYSMLSMFAAFLELMGVALIYPFVYAVLTEENSACYGASAAVIGFSIMIIFLLKNAFMLFFVNLQTKFTNNFDLLIREKFMKFFLYSDYQDTYKVSLAKKGKIFGLLIPNAMNEFILRLLNLIINLLIFAMISLLMAVKFPLAMIVTVIFATVFINIQNKVYKPMLTKLALRVSESSIPMNRAYNDAVLNIKGVKISHNEEYFFDNYAKATKLHYKNMRKLKYLNAVPPYITEPFVIVLLFVMLAIISVQTYDTPEKLIASFALIASAIFRLAPTISRIQVNLNGINAALPMVREFVDIYEDYGIYEKVMKVHKSEFEKMEDSVELCGVNFGYENGKDVLKGIDLKIRKGEFIGIAGSSGVGKTTLVDIISGLFRPDKGRILIDGRFQTEPLNIGYIPQEFKLIEGTIKDNVTFGNTVIDDEAVIKALKQACLYDFVVNNYKEGINANPFTDSIGFSQGQKQRLAIARALYANPDILIFDEATSSLDLKTEEEICHVLKALKGDKTIIVIAHRLSTIKSADKIIYMEDGRISGVGGFNELSGSSAGFNNLVKIAFKK